VLLRKCAQWINYGYSFKQCDELAPSHGFPHRPEKRLGNGVQDGDFILWAT
jgi:hypothetical protein